MKYAHIGLALWLLACAAFASPSVKLSQSGICHDSESPWFEKTLSFRPFASLEACLAAGGRRPKGAGPDDGPSSTQSHYQREHFGSGWADFDSDCRDARQEALAA